MFILAGDLDQGVKADQSLMQRAETVRIRPELVHHEEHEDLGLPADVGVGAGVERMEMSPERSCGNRWPHRGAAGPACVRGVPRGDVSARERATGSPLVGQIIEKIARNGPRA